MPLASRRRRGGDAGLRGLVNNAGIAQPSPIEIMPIDALRQQLEVNVVGQVAVTQAFLAADSPRAWARRQHQLGRRTCFSGRSGAYAASKFAIEALSDALRIELHPWGIHVSVIEPGCLRHRDLAARRRGRGLHAGAYSGGEAGAVRGADRGLCAGSRSARRTGVSPRMPGCARSSMPSPRLARAPATWSEPIAAGSRCAGELLPDRGFDALGAPACCGSGDGRPARAGKPRGSRFATPRSSRDQPDPRRGQAAIARGGSMAHEPRVGAFPRFFPPLRALTERDLAYLTEVDHHDHEALIGFDAGTRER